MPLLLLKTLIFTLIVPGTVAFVTPNLIAETEANGSFITAMLLMFLGFSAYSWCVWDFINYGLGTPAPIDAPKRLVIRGLYRYSRNPMYVAVIFVILSWAVLYASLSIFLYALLVAGVLNLFVVFYEEPLLHDEFGAEYRQYQVLVNRWLPGLKRQN